MKQVSVEKTKIASFSRNKVKSTNKVWLEFIFPGVPIDISQPTSSYFNFCNGMHNISQLFKIFRSGNKRKSYACLKFNILRMRNDNNILWKTLKSFCRLFVVSICFVKKQKAQNLSRGYTNKGTSLDFFTFLKEFDSCSLFSDRVSKAEYNVPSVKTSDFTAKLATKKLDLMNYPKIVGLKLFKI